MDELLRKIEARQARVAVVGLGHAGLPLAAAFARVGFPVVGLDRDDALVARLLRGEALLEHQAELARELAAGGRFDAVVDPGALGAADAVLLAVPTPLDPEREPDLSHVRAAAAVAARGPAGRLVVLTSTTYPGTTREVVGGVLAAAGLAPGRNVLLAYSPEREDPGRQLPRTTEVPRLVGGCDERSGDVCEALFRTAWSAVHRVSSAEAAEAAKLLENVYRAVNVALVNEVKLVLSALDLDVWEVIEAAATKPFGFTRFDPGPGMGGHCIPIDPYYLAWVARSAGHPTRFVELAGEINRAMPGHVVERLAAALAERGNRMRDARVLLLGLAYKADVGDVRESPALAILAELAARGARVRYADPHVPVPPAEAAAALEEVGPLSLARGAIEPFDAVVVATAHARTDWELVAREARLVVDARGALRESMAGDPRYVSA